MAATVAIAERNGASAGTPTAVTIIRYRTADVASASDNNNPIVKPAASYNYSYSKQHQLNVTVAPTGNMTNTRAYTDIGGSGATVWGTGIEVYFKTDATYLVPTLIAATTGYVNCGVSYYDSTHALTVRASAFTGTGYMTECLGSFMRVDSTVAAPGPCTSHVVTMAWDET
jgi:hypothetical protein